MDLKLQGISENEFTLINEAVRRLLGEYGVLFESPRAQKLLIDAGNKKLENGRISLSSQFIDKTIASIPADGFMLYGRDTTKNLLVAPGEMSFRPSTGMPFIFDYNTKRRRAATMADVRDLVILTDCLEHFDMVNSVASPAETPGKKGNLSLFLASHLYCNKPSDVTVSTREEVEAIGRIGELFRGSRRELEAKPLTAADISMITPLRCTKEESEAFIECAERGIPVEILTSPSMGVSAPITIAGAAVVSLAEMISAIGLLYCVRPGLGIINTARISPLNMRTTAYNYGAPELSMGSIIVAEFSKKYNIPCNLYGFGTVGKLYDFQVGFEKMFGGLLIALGGIHMITGSGTLDNSLVTAPEFLIVDHEMARVLKRSRKPVEITEESIGVEAFMQAMEGTGSMIAEQHTVDFLNRGELLDASLGQWCSFDQWQNEGSPDFLERAHKKAMDILHNYKPVPVDRALKEAAEKIIEEMKQ